MVPLNKLMSDFWIKEALSTLEDLEEYAAMAQKVIRSLDTHNTNINPRELLDGIDAHIETNAFNWSIRYKELKTELYLRSDKE